MNIGRKEITSLDLKLEAQENVGDVEFDFDGTLESHLTVNEDDDWVIKQDADKTGFAKWTETLTSRVFTDIRNCCVGNWCSTTNAIEILQQKGKKHFSMGFHKNGVRYFSPVEALWLLDEGGLYIFTSASPKFDLQMVHDIPTAPEKPFVHLVDSECASVGVKRERSEKEPDASESHDAKESVDQLMTFPQAYMFLVSKLNWNEFVVYSHLRSNGFVVLPHAQMESNAARKHSANTKKPMKTHLLPFEQSLNPVFDVYVRDGITSFRPSAPGPPDFYVILVTPSTPTPSPTQLFELESRLVQHSAELKRTLELKGKTVDVSAYPESPVVKAACVSDAIVTLYSIASINIHPQKSVHARPKAPSTA